VDWYFKALLRDRRFRILAGVGAGCLVLIVLAYLTGARWALSVAMFGLFPLFVLSILAIFAVLCLIVRADYLERQGRS
jgi:hypothetical protein